MVLQCIKEQLEVVHTSLGSLHSKLQTIPENPDDFNIDVKEECGLIEQTIDNLTKVHIKLKRHLNKDATINRLPVELLTYIILLTRSAISGPPIAHPYLLYTWVCHHWRSVLIQNAAFWTLIQPRRVVSPFQYELFQRSKHSKLDLILSHRSVLIDNTELENLFSKETNRIRRLQISTDVHEQSIHRLVASGKHFPSLRGFAFIGHIGDKIRRSAFIDLVSVLVFSDHLETLEFTLDREIWDSICRDRLALIFGRIRNLSVTLCSPGLVQSVIDLLHLNNKLQSLTLAGNPREPDPKFAGEVIFPELRSLSISNSSLLGCFRAPKLSSLEAEWISVPVTFNYSIIKEFDVSSIKYLYFEGPLAQCPEMGLRTHYCILGTTERVRCEGLFPKTDILFEDILSRAHPTACFHFKFLSQEIFDRALPAVLLSIPQLTSLIELRLRCPHTDSDCRRIVCRLPSIQRLVIQSRMGLTNLLSFLSNPSRGPHLKCLAYMELMLPPFLGSYADDVGRNLTDCIQSRRRGFNHELEYICLGNCPPLPRIWLEELRKLNIKIVTEDIDKFILENSATSSLKTEVGTVSTNVDGYLNTGVEKELTGLTEETMTRKVDNPLDVRLKDRSNMLTPRINRLPVELFTYIILLAPSSSIHILWGRRTHPYPYLSYTWVCRYWRSVLIQSPIFWTLIQPPSTRKLPTQETFYHELLRRSGSSRVDIILSREYTNSDTMLENLFVKENSRIRKLQLSNSRRYRLVLSGMHFPSLRGFALIDHCGIWNERSLSIVQLLPVLTASNYLDTFQCPLYKNEWASVYKDQMASVFSRLRNLSLILESAEIVGPVLDLLHNNTRLRSLQLSSRTYTRNSFGQFIFPELEFLSIENLNLMGHIQSPRLSNISAAQRFAPNPPDHLILKELDLSSIKYLWIRGTCQRDKYAGYCILGTKERIDCESIFSERTDILFGDYPICEYPRNCFHLKFSSSSAAISVLRDVLSSIIPLLTNLIELHLLFDRTYPVCREIIPRLSSSVQRIIVLSGNGLLGLLHLLSKPSRCPQLTHISYTMLTLPRDPKKYADDVGRSLMNCLQSRQDDSVSDVALKHIELGNCPPLPDIWLEELHKLGVEVVY
ncbi:hypothetical protein Clacol_009660 [Clathrus columnatus]|uniref:F-box domain-containing protein n=1 Tax=Clathrus columnatus TaxID=1419009 RepID=A0AAV5ARL0_9AGAM|nr:hypothetical protein Clacol_009660 [Clathrus columnatus]